MGVNDGLSSVIPLPQRIGRITTSYRPSDPLRSARPSRSPTVTPDSGPISGGVRSKSQIARLEEQHQNLEKALLELKTTQSRLLQAQKLEAIGQLAAGIAHEINTPTQYVTDNVEFLSRAFERVGEIVATCRELIGAVRAGKEASEAADKAEAAFGKARVDYILAEGPKAIAQSLDGLHRVASIVSAMKEFSHPSDGAKTPIDLNDAIATTIVVATNEWKYVADIHTELDPTLPLVRCLRDEVNQVVLNLIVNAAHAIDAVVLGGSNGHGVITISTHFDEADNVVEIRVADTGTGIAEPIRTRVFDPFFTTKPVGKGTGQGLAIAYSVIVEKHSGEIAFETEVGKGTTFIVRLPVIDEERPSTFFAPSRT